MKWGTAKIGGLLIAMLAVGFVVYSVLHTRDAHTTLEKYAAFRGCATLSDVTDDSARCALPSGDTITLVQINTKWYLEGDGPGVW